MIAVDLTLSKGISPNQGYVTIRVSGETWRTLRDGSLGSREAEVACRQLGFSYGTVQHKVYPTTIPDFLTDKYECTGTEKALRECKQISGPPVSVDNIYYYAGICCSNYEDFEEKVGQMTTGQCSVTWQEALLRCERRNMTFSTLPKNITYNGSRFWIGQFFTPWIWSDGCFMLNTPHGKQHSFNRNSPQMCLQFCGSSSLTQFALSGEVCRCLGSVGNKDGLSQTLPVQCDSHCSGNKRHYCGDGQGQYWSLFSIASQEGVFYKVDLPRSPSQCAVLLTEGHTNYKLQSEECSEKKGYICSDMRENGFVGFLSFGNTSYYNVSLQDARHKCRTKGRTLHLSGQGIITTMTLTDRARYNGLWVNIQRTVTATAMQIQNVSGNISPSLCISMNLTDGAKKPWVISNCQDRYLYACSMLEEGPPVVGDIDTTPDAPLSTKPYFDTTHFPRQHKETKGIPQVVYIGIGVAAGLLLFVLILIGVCCVRAKHSQEHKACEKQIASNSVDGGYELIEHTDDKNEQNMYDEIKDQDNSPENHFYQELEETRKDAELLNESQARNKVTLTEKISYAYPKDSVKDKHPSLQGRVSRASTDTKYIIPYDSLPVEKKS